MGVYNLLDLKLTVALNMASSFTQWVLSHVLKLFCEIIGFTLQLGKYIFHGYVL